MLINYKGNIPKVSNILKVSQNQIKKWIEEEDFMEDYFYETDMVFDSNNNPIVAFVSLSKGLNVMKYENEVWSPIGQADFATIYSPSTTHGRYNINIEISSNDSIYVSYIFPNDMTFLMSN